MVALNGATNLGNCHNLSIQDAFNQSTPESTTKNNSKKSLAMNHIAVLVENNTQELLGLNIYATVFKHRNLFERYIEPTDAGQERIIEIFEFFDELKQLKQKIIYMDSSARNKEYIEIIDNTSNIKETIQFHIENNTLSYQVFEKELKKIQEKIAALFAKFAENDEAKLLNIKDSARDETFRLLSRSICDYIKEYCKSFESKSLIELTEDIAYVTTYAGFFAKLKIKLEDQQLKNQTDITETLNKLINAFDGVAVNIKDKKLINENIPENIYNLMLALYGLIINESNEDLLFEISCMASLEIDFIIDCLREKLGMMIEETKDEALKTRGILRKIWNFVVSGVKKIFSILYNILLMPFRLSPALEQKN